MVHLNTNPTFGKVKLRIAEKPSTPTGDTQARKLLRLIGELRQRGR